MTRQWLTIGAASLVAGVAAFAASTDAVAQAAPKFGVFDAQRVSEETAIGKRVQVELGAFRTRKQQELSEKQQAINELEKQLSQQALSLSAERRAELERDIQRQLLELQSAQEAASRQMQLEFQSASAGFQEKLTQVVGNFGRQEGFTLILDRGLVAWASDTIDVTTTIVDLFDRMYPGDGAPPPGNAGTNKN
jgi:outer membrane protein